MEKKQEVEKTIQVSEAEKSRLKEHLLSGSPILGEGSPFSELLQKMVDGIMQGEMNDFLEEERASGKLNKRNGSQKQRSVLTNSGPIKITKPRARYPGFESELIPDRQRTLSSGMDEQILALYGQGNSYEDIRRLLQKMFGVSISTGKISAITDSILPIIKEWRNRDLLPFYAVLYLDAQYFKVRHEGRYVQRASYTVYSVDIDGNRDILGLYIQDVEGASRWATVLEDLKRRGVEDILVVCTDDLQGFSEVITDIFPTAVVQKCIVHMVRNSLRSVDDKDRKAMVKSLRSIYTSGDEQQAHIALETERAKWGAKYAYIFDRWEDKWGELLAFMDFPQGMHKMIYTTNPVEAVHRIIRKLIKGKAAWVSETALLKQMYLSLMQNEKSWRRKANGWKAVQRQIVQLYPERTAKYLG
ncbi:MAG: IS256 family transposase [Bacteroidota bacterium]